MGILEMLKGKSKKKSVEDNEIDYMELSKAGIEIQKGDARLKKGIRKDNLTQAEKDKLEKYRKSSD